MLLASSFSAAGTNSGLPADSERRNDPRADRRPLPATRSNAIHYAVSTPSPGRRTPGNYNHAHPAPACRPQLQLLLPFQFVLFVLYNCSSSPTILLLNCDTLQLKWVGEDAAEAEAGARYAQLRQSEAITIGIETSIAVSIGRKARRRRSSRIERRWHTARVCGRWWIRTMTARRLKTGREVAPLTEDTGIAIAIRDDDHVLALLLDQNLLLSRIQTVPTARRTDIHAGRGRTSAAALARRRSDTRRTRRERKTAEVVQNML